MNNKNVPTEDRALEIPNVLNTLESKLETLGEIIVTLEERLNNVSRPYKDDEPDATAAMPNCISPTGQRIDKSVTRVENAIIRLRNILDYLEV